MTPMYQALDLILGLCNQERQIQTLTECKAWLCIMFKLFLPGMVLAV